MSVAGESHVFGFEAGSVEQKEQWIEAFLFALPYTSGARRYESVGMGQGGSRYSRGYAGEGGTHTQRGLLQVGAVAELGAVAAVGAVAAIGAAAATTPPRKKEDQSALQKEKEGDNNNKITEGGFQDCETVSPQEVAGAESGGAAESKLEINLQLEHRARESLQDLTKLQATCDP